MQNMRMGWAMAMAALTFASHAEATPRCTPNAFIPAQHYPGAANIPPNNNLLLPSGKAVSVEGQRLIITGHVVDERCIPVPDAVVELWQTDPYGQLFLAQGSDLVNPNPTFAGAGRVITDRDGQFTFITAFPACPQQIAKTKAMSAPHVNLKILAPNFTPVTTMLFFENDRRNAEDVVYKKLSEAERTSATLSMNQGDNGDLNGNVTLVLDGVAPYRTY